MRFIGVIVSCLVAFAAATDELDAELLKRTSYSQTCRASKCAKAISSDRNGKKDCSSFLMATVTPCAVTSTSTVQCTVTAPLSVQRTTVTITETEVSTIETTLTIDETPSPTTVKETTVVTESETLFRRNAQPTKCPTTSRAGKVPARFCKACPQWYEFATACYCLGVRPSATTLKPATVTVTLGSCTTITPSTIVTESATETQKSTTEVVVTTINTLDVVTVTVTETSTTTLYPAAPTSTTCFRLRVPSENGAITSEVNQRDPLIFDLESVSYSFRSVNPSVPNIINTIRGYYIYAAPPRTNTGGGSLDGVRLTSNKSLAANFQCSFVNNRLQCTSTRDGIKTQLWRCNFRSDSPSDNTEVFIGQPGTLGNCRQIEIRPVIRPGNTCG
ncbi:hypothetical protein CERZMDRAFT_86036 [Cercospora zeae-maydis SCOH1-5]|uniref:Uncharacterized protein n=1 Tax=Cercospora zeae-maydis SCOH1-5 TaxID=717836 RepID=A0A6A6FBQ0_9PEZI|nr:hypothetical protein CERZMDRAFT_86036 [Cercospora zeae-maydis SCOH1-5]